MERLKQFYILREEDPSGVSGTGIIAQGVIFPSGKVVMEWCTTHTSIGIYESIDKIQMVHAHKGTCIVYI